MNTEQTNKIVQQAVTGEAAAEVDVSWMRTMPTVRWPIHPWLGNEADAEATVHEDPDL